MNKRRCDDQKKKSAALKRVNINAHPPLSFSPGNQAVAKVNKVQRSTSFGVPNANSIKQMLLDWCRAKTRSYEVSPAAAAERLMPAAELLANHILLLWERTARSSPRLRFFSACGHSEFLVQLE